MESVATGTGRDISQLIKRPEANGAIWISHHELASWNSDYKLDERISYARKANMKNHEEIFQNDQTILQRVFLIIQMKVQFLWEQP